MPPRGIKEYALGNEHGADRFPNSLRSLSLRKQDDHGYAGDINERIEVRY
jgi:hypothetical protein